MNRKNLPDSHEFDYLGSTDEIFTKITKSHPEFEEWNVLTLFKLYDIKVDKVYENSTFGKYHVKMKRKLYYKDELHKSLLMKLSNNILIVTNLIAFAIVIAILIKMFLAE